MSEQPKALQLADALDRLIVDALLSQDGNTAKTSAELRRLHALCEEMGAALEGVVRVADRATDEFDAARNAIAKWKESK